MGSACSGDKGGDVKAPKHHKNGSTTLDANELLTDGGHVPGRYVTHASDGGTKKRNTGGGSSLDINHATEEGGGAKGARPDSTGPRKLEPEQIQRIKISGLRASMFGECLSSDQLALLATLSELKKFSDIGVHICEQDARAEHIFVVHKGEVLLEVHDAGLDNRPNQAQMVKTFTEQDLTPITSDDQVSSMPSIQKHAAAQAVIQRAALAAAADAAASAETSPVAASSHLHPTGGASPATSVPGSPNTPAKRTVNHRANQSMAIGLSRAEAVASEAKTKVDANTKSNAAKDAAKNRSRPVTPAGPGSVQSSPQLKPRTDSRRPSEAAGLLLHAPGDTTPVPASPSLTYAQDTHSLFTAVKSATHLFGLGMFLNGGKYLYTAVNNSLSTHLIILPRKAFESLWMTYPTIKPVLLAHLGEALEASLADTSWLSSVPRPKLTLLTSLFTHARVDGGTMLMEEGDVCTDDSPLYYILSGEVELTLTNEKGHKSTKVLRSGTMFGELGCLLGFSITASAMALTPCYFRLCKRRFLNLFVLMAPTLLPALCHSLREKYHIRDEQLLENTAVQAPFTDFCLAQYSAENIEFFVAALAFRKTIYPLYSSLGQMDLVLNEAASIYNRFISETSLLQINIKQAVRKKIKATLQGKLVGVEVGKDLFVAAEREICNLMLSDTFARFKKAPGYAHALDELHAPPPAPILLNYSNSTAAAQGIRGKIGGAEYSNTKGAGLHTHGAHAVGGGVSGGGGGGVGKSQATRTVVALVDDDVDANAANTPLMFGGAKKGKTAASKAKVAGAAKKAVAASKAEHASGAAAASGLKVNVAPAAAASAATSKPPATAGGVRSPPHAPAADNPQATPSFGPTSPDNNHLATPNGAFGATGSPSQHSLAAPSQNGLSLSPGKDQFRMRLGSNAGANGGGGGGGNASATEQSASGAIVSSSRFELDALAFPLGHNSSGEAGTTPNRSPQLSARGTGSAGPAASAEAATTRSGAPAAASAHGSPAPGAAMKKLQSAASVTATVTTAVKRKPIGAHKPHAAAAK